MGMITLFYYSWLLPLFIKGFKIDLTEDDIYQHRKSHDSGHLGETLEAQWKKQTEKSKNPSLFKALTKVFFLEMLLLNIVIIIEETIR